MANDHFSVGEEAEQGIKNMQAYLLENFNIDYEIRTTDGSAEEELNLMLASGEYPDVIIGASTTMRQRFVDQGRVAELTDYLNEEIWWIVWVICSDCTQMKMVHIIICQ